LTLRASGERGRLLMVFVVPHRKFLPTVFIKTHACRRKQRRNGAAGR
jgi:hypothetical protein